LFSICIVHSVPYFFAFFWEAIKIWQQCKLTLFELVWQCAVEFGAEHDHGWVF
jgi:hypothetical protein